jgi:hypothetical protein
MTIYPTPGNPNVYATSGDQWLVGDPDHNYFGYSGSSLNSVTYQLATTPVNASLSNPSINTGDAAGDTYSDIQDLAGSPYGGSLYGADSGLPEQLIAEGGTNYLYGGTIYTTFVANAGADYMWATPQGTGLADYEVAPTGVVASLANPSINTGWAAADSYSNVHDLAGSGYDDVLYADNYTNDNLLGNGGDNILYAGSGNDTLSGGPGANILVGGAGSDWYVFGGIAEGPGDITMDPLSVIYNAEVGIYTTITAYDQNGGAYNLNINDQQIDLAPLLSSLNEGGDPVGSLVKIVEDTSGTFAWLEFDGPNGWVTLAKMNGLLAGDTVDVILNSSDASNPVTVQPSVPTNETNTDEWILAGGNWSASVSAGSYPGPDYKVVGIGDFTGNGTDDVLWYNVNTGDVNEWQLQNGQWSASVDLGEHPGVNGVEPGPGWQVEGVGNFFGAGNDDILWYNAGDNQTDIWKLNSNGQWQASVSPGEYPGVGEEVAGIGNFYGKSTSDILWYNAQTGDASLWDISNGQWAGSNDLGAHPGSGWQIAGVGNFFGPGTSSDVLWYNQGTGQTDIWEIANGQWQASVSPGTHPTGYEVAAVGDFTGNGTSDILFYNPTTGNADEWEIANGKWAASVDLGSHPGSNWQIAGAGNFTGNGTSDVLFTQTALK